MLYDNIISVQSRTLGQHLSCSYITRSIFPLPLYVETPEYGTAIGMGGLV